MYDSLQIQAKIKINKTLCNFTILFKISWKEIHPLNNLLFYKHANVLNVHFPHLFTSAKSNGI